MALVIRRNSLDFQQFNKKTEAFIAGVIKEMMLEWAAEQMADCDDEERGVQHLEFVPQQMYTALRGLTNYEANDVVAAEEPIGGMAEAAEKI